MTTNDDTDLGRLTIRADAFEHYANTLKDPVGQARALRRCNKSLRQARALARKRKLDDVPLAG